MGTGLEPSSMAVSEARVSVAPSAPVVGQVPPKPVPSVLQCGELYIGSGPFDPADEYVWPQLAEILDVGEYSTIEEMEGFHGGLNEGIWFLESGEEKLVLKLVKSERSDSTLPTDAENYIRLYQEHCGIVSDPVLAFPSKILGCYEADADEALTTSAYLSASGKQRRYDLFVMRRLPGVGLAEVVANKRLANQIPELLHLLERLGAVLRDFHKRYGGCQHGDFQPGNIFYDEDSDVFAFIDVGGMGIPTVDSDVDHFSKALRYFEKAYGSDFVEDCLRCFERGYRGRGRSEAEMDNVLQESNRNLP